MNKSIYALLTVYLHFIFGIDLPCMPKILKLISCKLQRILFGRKYIFYKLYRNLSLPSLKDSYKPVGLVMIL